MKTLLKPFFIICMIFLQSLNATEPEDSIIEMDGSIEVNRVGDAWLRISVPFSINSHPDFDSTENGRPGSLEELTNPKYLDNLGIRLVVCFRNEFKRKYVRGDKKDIKFNDYYSSEIEVQVLEIDRVKKYASFLFPAIITERDEYASSVPKPLGFVVEFTRKGRLFNVSKSVAFDNYTKDETLSKFKEDALSRCSVNDGVLIPAYLVEPESLRNLGPVVRKI